MDSTVNWGIHLRPYSSRNPSGEALKNVHIPVVSGLPKDDFIGNYRYSLFRQSGDWLPGGRSRETTLNGGTTAMKRQQDEDVLRTGYIWRSGSPLREEPEQLKHNKPHIHVRYGESEAVYGIPVGDLLEGNIPRGKEKLVLAWIELRKEDLMADWQLAVAGQAVFKIEPLK